jgi:hypothetical protein
MVIEGSMGGGYHVAIGALCMSLSNQQMIIGQGAWTLKS